MSSTFLTASILLGITFLFIFSFSFAHKRGRKKEAARRKSRIADVLTANNFIITEKEEFANHFIAIDTKNGKLVYMEFEHTEPNVELIDLQKIQSAKVHVAENNVYEERKRKSIFLGSHISEVQLELVVKDPEQCKSHLTFYRVLVNGISEMNFLKGRAQYWQGVINSYIKQFEKKPAKRS